MAVKQKVAEKSSRRKKIRKADKAVVHIHATFNNTILTLTDQRGDVLAFESAGKSGFSGSKKSTPYAGTVISNKLIEAAQSAGVRELSIVIRGVGSGRDSAVRALANSGLEITRIVDRTPLAHNGVRRPNTRRV